MSFNVNSSYTHVKENVAPNLYQYAYETLPLWFASSAVPGFTMTSRARMFENMDPGKRMARKQLIDDRRRTDEMHSMRVRALNELLNRMKLESRHYRNLTEGEAVDYQAAPRAVIPPPIDRSGSLADMLAASSGDPAVLGRMASHGDARSAKHTTPSNAKHTTPASKRTASGKKRYEEYI